MHDRKNLALLRQNPMEWRRHGLTPPAALQAMVDARVRSYDPAPSTEPSYADFFAA